jgi:hypothetical protein
MIDNKKLAAYIRRRMREEKVENIWDLSLAAELVEIPTNDELAFWIQQYKTKDCCGHSGWSERYQRNIWIKDEE